MMVLTDCQFLNLPSDCETHGDGTPSHLFGSEERLVADAGDDDGVHVHLLPQLLVVRQVQGLVVQLLEEERIAQPLLLYLCYFPHCP